MTSPFIPCSFTYGDAPAGGAVMPMVIAGRNPSNTIDIQYPSGYFWLSDLSLGGSGNLYYQGGFVAGSPVWTLVSNSGGVLDTLSDGSTTVAPIGGNIALEGTVNQITSTADAGAHTITFSIPTNFIAPGAITATSTLSVGTNLSVTGTSTLTGDVTMGDDLVVTDDVSIGGDLAVTGTITFTDLSVDGTVAFNTSGAGTTTIGNAAAGAITIDVGTGNLQVNGGGNQINIGNDAAANPIVIGSQTALASTHIQAGTGDLLLDGSTTAQIILGSITQTGQITIGRSTAGQNISIGSAINASAQTISIANGASAANSTVNILSGVGTAGAGTLALGNNTRVTVAGLADIAPAAARTVTVGGGTITTAITDTIDIAPDGATTNASAIKLLTLNNGGVTTGQVITNIASGTVTSGTHTTTIAGGNRAAGTMALNLMTGTGTKTATIGNADGLTTTNILGPHNINVNQNNNTAINTGTSTGTVSIGNSAAGAITVDTAAGISLDGATASNFTVTGAGADLTLASVGGSVLVDSTEDAALAIRLHANGGTSETIQIHSDQGTGAASIDILSDVGGITLTATGNATADAININAAAGGIDMDSALLMSLTSTRNNAQAILVEATAGGIDILASGAAAGEDIDIIATGSSVNITATEAAANAIVLTASNAIGGIDITTGGGSVDISSAGFATVAAATDTQASPTATATISTNVGRATFTGFTTAAAASQVFVITNTLVTTSSCVLVTVCNEGANDAQLTIQRVTRAAGSFSVTVKNNGAAALNGNVAINFWVLTA